MLNVFYRRSFKFIGQFRLRQSLKKLSFRTCSNMTDMKNLQFTEIRIPTDYGFIAAKQWGNSRGRPVLALHGWQDNAGSFDPLVPWLDSNLRIVAVDFPGHGLSSHKPKGCHYHFMESLLDIKLVLHYLKWTKFILLGHSMGGGLGLLYASLFPGEVEAVVTIDIFKPLTVKPDLIPTRTANAIKHRLLINEKLKQPEPAYTEEMALQRLFKGQGGSTTENSARVLIKRGVKPAPDGKGVVYTRDLRIQAESIQNVDDQMMKVYLSKLRCRFLFVKARSGLSYEKPETLLAYRELYSANCKDFLMVEVEGTHHVHMNNPETVAPVINTFLDSSRL